MSAVQPLVAVATIPVPAGWTFIQEDSEEMPSIERNVGAFTLTIGLDDCEWRWWLCLRGSWSSVEKGRGEDLVDSIWQVFDALARRLDEPPGRSDQLVRRRSACPLRRRDSGGSTCG